MKTNIQNISKAVLTAAFGLFLISCNNSGTSTGVKAQDTNTGGNTTDPNVTTPPQTVLDTTAPTITSITGFETRPSTTAPIEVTVNFSEMVSGLAFDEIMTAGLVALTAADISPASTVMTMSYTITVTPLDSLTNDAVISLMILEISAKDSATNGNIASEVAMTTWEDPNVPMVMSSRIINNNDSTDVLVNPTAGTNFLLEVTFSENVTIGSGTIAYINATQLTGGNGPQTTNNIFTVGFLSNGAGAVTITIPAGYITAADNGTATTEDFETGLLAP